MCRSIRYATIRLGATRVPIVLQQALTESALSALAATIISHHSGASASLLQTTAWKLEHSQQLCKQQRPLMVEQQRVVRGQLLPLFFLLTITYCI